MSVILVDFDGTVRKETPRGYYSKDDIGSEKVLKELISKGHKIVLWTCRNNSLDNPYNYDFSGSLRKETSLDEAVRWFEERGIELYGVNEVPDQYDKIGESGKLLCDLFIDNKGLGIPLREEPTDLYRIEDKKLVIGRKYTSEFVDWEKVRDMLISKGLL